MNDEIKLTEQQQDAFNKITAEFAGDTPKMAILTGSAGTGKTTLTKSLAKALDPALCALTHKAAAVMRKAADREVYTLANILKQRKTNNHETGESEFKTQGKIQLPHGKRILFIDETSMMNEANFKQVLESIACDYHVLFIGDEYQLPPVKEAFSHSLQIEGILKVSLTVPLRCKANSGIDKSATTVRNALVEETSNISGMSEVMAECNAKGSEADVLFVTATEAAKMMIEAFGNKDNELDDVRIISYTNKRVESFNYHLKRELTNETMQFTRGDVVLSNSAYYCENKSNPFSSDKEMLLENNQEILLEQDVEVEEYLGIKSYLFLIKGNRVMVPVDLVSFNVQVDDMVKSALMQPKGSSKRREKFREMFDFKEAFADIRLCYALTVHKSQGSSYKTCFFDLTGLDTATVDGKKLLYTGITRASEKLILFPR